MREYFFGFIAFLCRKKLLKNNHVTLGACKSLIDEFYESDIMKPTTPTTIYARDVPKKIVVDAK